MDELDEKDTEAADAAIAEQLAAEQLDLTAPAVDPAADPFDGAPPPEVKKGGKKKKRRPSVDAHKSAPDPFAGGPPRGDDRRGDARGEDDAPQKKASAQAVLVDPKQAAETIVAVLDGLAQTGMQARYGHIPGPEGQPLVALLATSKEEREGLVEAFALFMQASAVQLSPGANLALVVGMTYGAKVIALEGALRAQARARAAA